MHRFTRILFYASADAALDPAFARALALAARNGASLTLMDVLDPVPGIAGGLIPGWSAERLAGMIADARRAELEDLAARAREQGVAAEVEVAFGKPHLEITRAVLGRHHDLLVKGVPAGRAEGLISTDMHLMRECPAPVWVIKGNYTEPPFRILAAVDPDPEDPEEDPLNGRILALASALANWEAAELHVVHAWQVVGEAMLRSGRARLTAREVEALERGIEESHRYRLKALTAAHLPDPRTVVPHLAKGDPAEVILATAEAQQANVIVMGTLARSGLAGLLIGNTAEEVLKRSRASLLTVKPDDFRSPVELEA